MIARKARPWRRQERNERAEPAATVYVVAAEPQFSGALYAR